MYSNLSLWLSLVFIVGGLVALSWSSDLFVDGAAAFAKKLGVSSFIVGMVVIGFGTCAPEFFVSLFSGVSNHANLSLGNAYGSCVFNVAGVLGITALIAPLTVQPTLVFVGAPLMTVIALLSMVMLDNGILSYRESVLLIIIFIVAMPAYCWYDQKKKGKREGVGEGVGVEEGGEGTLTGFKMVYALLVGLGVMVAASYFLVWGSVNLARAMGVGELVIGLTIVAIGTSVPELASAIAAARKGESELVLGNIVGSNLFNMLCVVGTAGALSPEPVSGYSTSTVVFRDLGVLTLISITIFLFGLNRKHPHEAGKVTRFEGFLWTVLFFSYLTLTVYQEVFKHG